MEKGERREDEKMRSEQRADEFIFYFINLFWKSSGTVGTGH